MGAAKVSPLVISSAPSGRGLGGEYLAHDVPHVGIVHRVALDRSCVTVQDVHQVPFLAVLKHQVQLVDLNID